MGQFQILQDVPSRQSAGSSTRIINKSSNILEGQCGQKTRNNIVTNSILFKNGPH